MTKLLEANRYTQMMLGVVAVSRLMNWPQQVPFVIKWRRSADREDRRPARYQRRAWKNPCRSLGALDLAKPGGLARERHAARSNRG